MKGTLLNLAVFVAYSANLLFLQQPGDVLQPIELSTLYLGQMVRGLTQNFEQQLLSALYPARAAEVQAAIDSCEAVYWDAEVADLQALGLDAPSLATACLADDPFVPVNQFFQDLLTYLLQTVAPQCSLDVDLVGDLNRFIGTSAQQVFELLQPAIGSSIERGAAALQPMEVSYTDLEPEDIAVRAIDRQLGATEEEMDRSSVYAQPEVDGISAIVEDFAAAGVPLASDVASELSSFEGLWYSNAFGYADLLRRLTPRFAPAVRSICAYFTG